MVWRYIDHVAGTRWATHLHTLLERPIARSEITIDLGAVRRNAKLLLEKLVGSELWAVVKADGYGHGAVNAADGALGAGATGLCVATVGEGLVLRPEFPTTRIVVFGPVSNREIAYAREARLELVSPTTARCRRACRSTLSSTQAWAATGSPSCRRRRRRSSA